MRVVHEKTLYQLAFLPRLFPVNCYLVEEEKSLTLIDAALPYSAKAILQTASRIGKPITRHCVDARTRRPCGGARCPQTGSSRGSRSYFRTGRRLLSGDRTLLPGEPETPIRGGVPKKLKTRADLFLKEGDQIGSLRVISTPGHTPGSVAFLDTRHGFLIAGDAFQTRGGIAVSGQLRRTFPFPAMATWNKRVALESARKLADLQPSLLAVGHGRMIQNPQSAILRALQEAERNVGRDAHVAQNRS